MTEMVAAVLEGFAPLQDSTVYLNAPYAVGWGTLTLINAGLAQSKGRSGLLWWIISVFLGPVATLLIVLLPKVK